MEESDYIVVQGWMRGRLGLSGSELLTFAVVYGFSRDGVHWFHGSRGYIAEWIGCSKDTVSRCLKSLASKGLIERRDTTAQNGMTYTEYRQCVPPAQIADTPSAKCIGGGMQNAEGGVCKMPTNNLVDKTRSKNIEEREEAKRTRRFTPPSVEEVRAYCRERGNSVDPESFVAFYGSKGWKVGSSPMKDWKQAVITWEKREDRERSDARKPKNVLLGSEPTAEDVARATERERMAAEFYASRAKRRAS